MKKIILIVLLFWIQNAFAGTFYVSTSGNDQNNGTSSATAWKTIYKACNSVSANAGHSIQIAAGNYQETATILIPSGTTIMGAGRKSTIVTCTQSPIFKTENSSGVKIKSLTLDGRNRTNYNAVFAKNVNNFEMSDFKIDGFNEAITLYISSNVKIYDFEGVDPGYCTAQAINMLESATDVEIWNANVVQDNNTPGKIVGAGPDQSKNPSAPWTLPRAKITRLKVHDIVHQTPARGCWEVSPGNYPPGFSIELWHCELSEVELYNNHVRSGFSIQSNGFGYSPTAKTIRVHDNFFDLRAEYRFALEMSTHNMEVDHNYFLGGYYPLCDFGSEKIQNSKVHHNVFEDGQSQLVSNFTGGVNEFEFSNNTVIVTSNSTIFSFGAFSNLRVRNNIFTSTGAFNNNFGSSGAVVSTNLFDGVTSTGSGVISANPSFTATGTKPSPYYTLKSGSPAIDAGIVIAGITNGYLGAKPDLGAYEYSSNPTSLAYLMEESFLWSIFPNPVSGNAVIRYSLPENGNVNFSVYDLLGNKVQQLVNETQTEGKHQLNLNTSQLQNGIYFVKMNVNGRQQTQKLMVRKSE